MPLTPPPSIPSPSHSHLSETDQAITKVWAPHPNHTMHPPTSINNPSFTRKTERRRGRGGDLPFAEDKVDTDWIAVEIYSWWRRFFSALGGWKTECES